ncbi:angiopoietin-related protein 2-like [Haliotis asinina]|uniref:angiopoietin-related protein 2-like n=1 Tax=Haliotis asinina TaxID=109174 RepID=UPI0035325D77
MIECSVICLSDPDCLSASYCKTTDGYTCQLSGLYADGSCSGLVADGNCIQTAMMDPCENGGTFFSENRTCHCAHGFVGDYCQRRYRDCLESPQANTHYYLEPLDSNHVFEWHCEPAAVNYTLVAPIIQAYSPNYTLSWQQFKHGIPRFTGFYFIGLENLHQLTKQGVYDLVVYLIKAGGGPYGSLAYRNFKVGSESEGYALRWEYFEREFDNVFSHSEVFMDGFGGFSDATKNLNGARFGTYDNDIGVCARTKNAGWWYNPVGCSMISFGGDGLYWPTNTTGTVGIENVMIVMITMKPVYWYKLDDLVL